MASSIPLGLDDMRIVMLGNSGVGKSATANAILGRETFRESETAKCEIRTGRVHGRNISVIDTPGINSATRSSEQLKTEMRRCLSLSDPGPHVFLLVIRVGTFAGDSRTSVKWIQENFGEEALKFTMVLFTGREEISSSKWSAFIEETNVQNFTKQFRGGYAVINSKREINPSQISKLLEKIDKIVEQNRGKHYTDKIYEVIKKQKAEKSDQHDEDQKRTEIEKQKQDQESDTEATKRKGKEDLDKSQQDRKRQGKEGEMHGICMCYTRKDDQKRESDMTQENMFKTIKEIRRILEEQTFKSVDDKESDIKEKEKTVVDEAEKKQARKDESFRFPTKAIRENERLKQDLKRQEESRRERERRKWENERAATGGSSDTVSDVRIVLMGKPGSGKSTTGNTILGREAFGKDLINIPGTATMCKRQDGMVGNKSVTVIDTKGNMQIFHKSPAELSPSEFEQCLQLCPPGPHVFLLVKPILSLPFDTLYPEIDQLGPEFMKCLILLITLKDVWETVKDDDDIVTLVQLINTHQEHLHFFSNEEQEDRTQVTQLLEKIEASVQKNKGMYYTNEMYQEAKKAWIEAQSSNCSVL